MRPRVVIIGGGFGGLEAARALAREPVEVTVIDRQNYHLFQPLLYQVATALLSPAEVAWPIRSMLRRQANATVVMAEVVGIDMTLREVITTEGRFPYEYLVLATGATHSYFGHDEWADVAPGLKRVEDATRIRRQLLSVFERAEITADPVEREKLLTFVIVGAGPTGVEMAGAVVELACNTLPAEFRHCDPSDARIILVEAGPRVLPAFPEELSEVARQSLVKMGVDVRTSTRVVDCDPDGVDLADGRIEARTVIWAAGVVASPAAEWIGAPHDRAGRVKVGPDLSVPGFPEIFAVGDTAAVEHADGRPVPGIAPAAKQMGSYVGRLIAARIGGRKPQDPFRYRHQGDLATVGRHSAIVSLGRMRLTGVIGWLFWSVAHIYFLIGARNRIAVALNWLWSYFTFQRGARLITKQVP